VRGHDVHRVLVFLFCALLVVELTTLREVANSVEEACLGAKLVVGLDGDVFEIDIVVHIIKLVCRLRVIKLVHQIKAGLLIFVSLISVVRHHP
jgi:hypothetical protein